MPMSLLYFSTRGNPLLSSGDAAAKTEASAARLAMEKLLSLRIGMLVGALGNGGSGTMMVAPEDSVTGMRLPLGERGGGGMYARRRRRRLDLRPASVGGGGKRSFVI